MSFILDDVINKMYEFSNNKYMTTNVFIAYT